MTESTTSQSSTNGLDLSRLIERLDKVEKELLNCKKDIKSLREVNNNLQDTIYDLEMDLNCLNQYGRWENIEIANIPETVLQDVLEEHVQGSHRFSITNFPDIPDILR